MSTDMTSIKAFIQTFSIKQQIHINKLLNSYHNIHSHRKKSIEKIQDSLRMTNCLKTLPILVIL